jgi:hypothetical protein
LVSSYRSQALDRGAQIVDRVLVVEIHSQSGGDTLAAGDEIKGKLNFRLPWRAECAALASIAWGWGVERVVGRCCSDARMRRHIIR